MKQNTSLTTTFLICLTIVFSLNCSKNKSEDKAKQEKQIETAIPDSISKNIAEALIKNEEPISFQTIVISPSNKAKKIKWISIGGSIVVGTVTSYFATPIVGQWVGSVLYGLNGVAATNAGLALFGGGALGTSMFAFGMAGGTFVVSSITDLLSGSLTESMITLVAESGSNEYHKKAKEQFDAERYDIARYYYNISIVEKKDVLKSYYSIGLINLTMRNYSEAIRYFKYIYQYSPNSALACGQIGNAYLASGEYEKGIKYLLESVKIEPIWEDGYLLLHQAYKMNNQPQNSYDILLQGVKNCPDSYLLNFQLGIIFIDKSDLLTASAYFDKAVAIDDSYPDGLIFQSLVNDKLGERKRALDALVQVESLMKENTPYGLLHKMAEYYLAERNLTKGRLYLEKAISQARIQMQTQKSIESDLSELEAQLNILPIEKTPWYKFW